ncbi:hypothetical protein DFH08DRAFT_827722 [Mycena albidolilacea]|uniref:Uncharacterized protein n=1 Tax=Mycena albidolilacea TaxID=1033008 RepID=A0AAD6YXZ7_9AGAR|nr:hypothetical protein DFH08DRAFT_827722 [Mycena albidolilacea]
MDDNFASGASSPASSLLYSGETSSMLGYGSDIHKPHTAFDQWNYRGLRAPSTKMPIFECTSSRRKIAFSGYLAIKSAYHKLVTAVPSLIAATSNPFGLPVAAASGAGPGPSPFGQLKTPPAPLLKSDYPFVECSWPYNNCVVR